MTGTTPVAPTGESTIPDAHDDPRHDLRDQLGYALHLLDQIVNGKDVQARAELLVAAQQHRLAQWRNKHS